MQGLPQNILHRKVADFMVQNTILLVLLRRSSDILGSL